MIDDHEDPLSQQSIQKRGQVLLSRRTLFAASLATIAAAQVSRAFAARPLMEQINPDCVYAYAYVYVLE